MPASVGHEPAEATTAPTRRRCGSLGSGATERDLPQLEREPISSLMARSRHTAVNEVLAPDAVISLQHHRAPADDDIEPPSRIRLRAGIHGEQRAASPLEASRFACVLSDLPLQNINPNTAAARIQDRGRD